MVIPVEYQAVYVVVNEHTLGFYYPVQPNTLSVLRALVRKGATWTYLDDLKEISSLDVVRKATLADFAEYRCMPPPNFA